MQPYQRFHLAAVASTSPEERTEGLARAFVAAGGQPEIVDASLRMVATTWSTPTGFPTGEWTRRWVAVLANDGSVTVRGEMRACRSFSNCAERAPESMPDDVKALQSFATRLGESLGVAVVAEPTKG
jgi:hypothetical protein